MTYKRSSLEERSIRHQSYVCRQDNFLLRKYEHRDSLKSYSYRGFFNGVYYKDDAAMTVS